MQLVVDVNVLFSGLISGREQYFQLVQDNELFLPDFALFEIQKYQELIVSKTSLSADDLKNFTIQLFKYVIIVPNFLISTRNYIQAFEYCKDVDAKDTAYVALALELDVPLLTKDTELVQGLRAKGFTQTILLHEYFNP